MKTDRYRRKEYPIYGETKIQGEWYGFWCKIKNKYVITTDVGEHMAASSKVITTPSDLQFAAGQRIWLEDGKEYIVENSDSDIDTKHKGVRRGATRYVTRIEVT